MIFQGFCTSVAKKHYIFVIFQGGGSPDPLPPLWIRTYAYGFRLERCECVMPGKQQLAVFWASLIYQPIFLCYFDNKKSTTHFESPNCGSCLNDFCSFALRTSQKIFSNVGTIPCVEPEQSSDNKGSRSTAQLLDFKSLSTLPLSHCVPMF